MATIIGSIADKISATEVAGLPLNDYVEAFLRDTQGAPIIAPGEPQVIGVGDFGDHVSFTGLGSQNELQSMLFGTGTASDVTTFGAPGTDVVITASGNSVITVESAADGSAFVQHIVDTVIGGSADPAAQLVGASLNLAANLIGGASPIHIVSVLNTAPTGEAHGFEGFHISAPADATLGLNLNGVDFAAIVGAASVIAAGSGTVIVDPLFQSSVLLAADSRDQVLIGGIGNDTIVGGGGNDTIVGGAGSDIFVVSGNLYNPGALSHETLTIADFGQDDILRFTSYEDLDDLKDNLLNLFESSAGVVAMFADGSAIVLVGVELEDLHKDLFDFG